MATPLVLLYDLARRQARRLVVAFEQEPAAVPALLARLGHTVGVIGSNTVRMSQAERALTEQVQAAVAQPAARPVTPEQAAAVCRLLDGLTASDGDGVPEDGEAREHIPIT